MALPPHNFQTHNKIPTVSVVSFPDQANPRLNPRHPPRAPWVTFLPAEPGVPQDPILMVIKVDFSVGWEEGVGQFPCGAIKAVVGQGLQAVRVVDGVETCGKSSRLRGIQQDQPARKPLDHWKGLWWDPRFLPTSRATK